MKFAKTFILFMCFLSQIFAQQVTLYRVNVEGNTTTSDKMIKYSAGLEMAPKSKDQIYQRLLLGCGI